MKLDGDGVPTIESESDAKGSKVAVQSGMGAEPFPATPDRFFSCGRTLCQSRLNRVSAKHGILGVSQGLTGAADVTLRIFPSDFQGGALRWQRPGSKPSQNCLHQDQGISGGDHDFNCLSESSASHRLFIPDGGGRGLIRVTTSPGLSLPWLDFKVPCLAILDLEYAPLRPPSPHPSMSGGALLRGFFDLNRPGGIAPVMGHFADDLTSLLTHHVDEAPLFDRLSDQNLAQGKTSRSLQNFSVYTARLSQRVVCVRDGLIDGG